MELPDDIINIIVSYALYPTLLQALPVNHTWKKCAIKALKKCKNPLKDLLKCETTTQSELAETLLLSGAKIKKCEYVVKKMGCNGYGRIAHIYETHIAVSRLFKDNGGIIGYAQRLEKKEHLARLKKIREQEKRKLQDKTRKELVVGLHALGLRLRSDSNVCQDYIASCGKKSSLEYVLTTMTHMHWLFNHTNGGYSREILIRLELARVNRELYPGIRRDISNKVKSELQFQLPQNGLPWLPRYETTKDAIDAAVKNAKPTRPLPPPNPLDKEKSIESTGQLQPTGKSLHERRAAALMERCELFEKARSDKSTFIKTAEDLNKTVEYFLKNPQTAYMRELKCWKWGGYFDKVLNPKLKLPALLEYVQKFEDLVRRKVELVVDLPENHNAINNACKKLQLNCPHFSS